MRRRIARRAQAQPDIPTASQGDIAFLLIIFFMLTTHVRTDQGIKGLTLPRAQNTERVKIRGNVANCWVDKSGRMTMQDYQVTPTTITSIMSEKMMANDQTVVLLLADKEASYGYVTDVLEACKAANALKVTFATDTREQGGAR